jgi:hypothetical protein
MGLPIYSTTADEFPLHTDEYREPNPSDTVLTLCVEPDLGGEGVSFVVPLEPVVSVLPDDLTSVLSREEFPTEYGLCSILSASDGGLSVKYNRREIHRFAELRRISLSSELADALDRFDAALKSAPRRIELLLERGDCLVLNNRTTLHGRTRFDQRSHRLLKRLRLHRRRT